MISRIYILAKNEESNIGRCLESVTSLGIPITVLDSGSTDETPAIVATFAGVVTEEYPYVNHCTAYNEIALRHTESEAVVVLDADMQIDAAYLVAVEEAFASSYGIDAALSPVAMYSIGKPLRYGSLYPPKPAAFRGGRVRFEPVGHGERLVPGTATVTVDVSIIHDDRRPYEAELAKQWRYAKVFARATASGDATWRDVIRYRSPLFIVATPLVSYAFRRGILSGRVGAIYALDRMIAEALAYRAAIASKVQSSMPDQTGAAGSSSPDPDPRKA